MFDKNSNFGWEIPTFNQKKQQIIDENKRVIWTRPIIWGSWASVILLIALFLPAILGVTRSPLLRVYMFVVLIVWIFLLLVTISAIIKKSSLMVNFKSSKLHVGNIKIPYNRIEGYQLVVFHTTRKQTSMNELLLHLKQNRNWNSIALIPISQHIDMQNIIDHFTKLGIPQTNILTFYDSNL
ncbi:MAG: hypothetical protein KIH69_010145 [Anaerolineae bacterium]|nr:hypothetical protein [Anaerolineae bacterium]